MYVCSYRTVSFPRQNPLSRDTVSFRYRLYSSITRVTVTQLVMNKVMIATHPNAWISRAKSKAVCSHTPWFQFWHPACRYPYLWRRLA